MGNVHSCRSNNNNNNNNQNQNNNNALQFNLNYNQYWQCYCWGEGVWAEFESLSCFVVSTPQQCLPPYRLPPVPRGTQFIHMCSQRHAYTVHANTHIVIQTTTAATVHIQPVKQDGCAGFVALLRFFDCMLVSFFFTLLYYFRFSPFREERRALRAQA